MRNTRNTRFANTRLIVSLNRVFANTRFPPLFCNFSFSFLSKSFYRRLYWSIFPCLSQNDCPAIRKSKISERKSVFTFFDPLRPKNIIFDRFFQLPEVLEWDLFHPKSKKVTSPLKKNESHYKMVIPTNLTLF